MSRLFRKIKGRFAGILGNGGMKKLVLMNIPYVFAAIVVGRGSYIYRMASGNINEKVTYLMAHSDRIVSGVIPSLNMQDLLAGTGAAVIMKLVVLQKRADAKKLRKGVEYGSARWGTADDIKPYQSDNPWMNIPLTATESLSMESRPKNPKYARNKNILVIGGSGSGKTRFFVKPSIMQMNCSYVVTDPKGLIYKVQRNKRFFITKKRLFACIFKAFEERR